MQKLVCEVAEETENNWVVVKVQEVFGRARKVKWGIKSRPGLALTQTHTTCSQATNLSNSPLGGVTPSDPETLLRSPLVLLPSPPRQGSGSLRFAVLTGNSSLPAGACVSLLMSRTTFPREPRGRGWLCHLTRTLARQWRHPYCGVAVLEGVGLLPALTAVLATEEGPQLGPGAAGKGDRDQWLSSFSALPRSWGKGILFHTITPHLVWGGRPAGLGRRWPLQPSLQFRRFDQWVGFGL